MLKDCRILDKKTNKISMGQIYTEFEGQDFYNLVEIPNDGKTYIFKDGQVIEKPVDPASLDYIQTSFGRLKKVTPVGDLPTVINSLDGMVNKLGKLSANTIRFYDENDNWYWNTELTKEQFDTLYLEFIQAYKNLDVAQ